MKPALSLYGSLTGWAIQTPAAPFVIEADSERVLTYGACRDAVHGLLDWLGREPSTIALALPGGRATAVAWLAALSGGHTLVPASTDATEDERARLTARYRPDIIIAPSEAVAAGFGCPEARVLTGDRLDSLIDGWIASPPEPQPTSDDGYLCLTTSGTTGIPKGVRLRADQIAWTADQIRRSHGLTQADRGLAVLPFFHINAPVVSLCSTLMAGGLVVIAARFSRSRFWAWIDQYQITWASIVPTIVAVLLQTEPPDWLPGTLQFVRTASAPLPVVHLHQFERRFGVPVIETYGLSEAASTVSANPVPPGRHKPGTVGLPLGVRLRVCEPNLTDAPQPLVDIEAGREGEICVSGPNLISGYDGGAGARAFSGEWFRTGDLGWQDEDGYLHITGRIGDVINRGGEKISPREIEELLLRREDVKDVAVVGRAHPIYGQQPVAFFVPEQDGDDGLGEALADYCSRHLSPYKVPAAFVEVDMLPRTRTGKIQRHLVGADVVTWQLAGTPAAGGSAQ